jgi:hypothetical protein
MQKLIPLIIVLAALLLYGCSQQAAAPEPQQVPVSNEEQTAPQVFSMEDIAQHRSGEARRLPLLREEHAAYSEPRPGLQRKDCG